MKLINKKKLQGFTLNKEYEFIVSEEDVLSCLCYEVVDDIGEEWFFSKYKMLEYFTFNVN